ncbi:hypothetical protein E1263_04240 [Kribbella antibiotica]|uniref:Secreted protein n=1 Tax=Kribbella antibiotica TaxID=190195 RepID=A0A4R4ZYU5_9ACTN|nr:DUF6049 family protein [Kribbella antibiotica]TDD62372.1 hypothetical protein E1263_04240 [Kribbella antibiotica]
MFRRRLRLSAAVTASLLIVAPAAISAVPAAAVDDEPTVEVAIDSFSPAAPKPGDTVTIKGTVTNTSATTFGASPQVVTCIDHQKLNTAAEIAAISNEQNVPMNDRDSCVGIGVQDSDSPTYKVLGEQLAPKAKVAFTVSVPWKDWRITSDTGVYTVGVMFRGTPEGRSRTTAGRARTLMPVIGAKPPTRKVSTALVIPLVQPPTYLGGFLFTDDSLAQSMGPGGELRRLLDLGKKHKVTWLVDPALIKAAEQMTAVDGYGIGRTASAYDKGTKGAIAAQWLSDFSASQDGPVKGDDKGDQVVALPYGDVDVAGLVDAGGPLKDLVRQARMESERAGLGSARTNGLWLENGSAASRYLAFASSGFPGVEETQDLNLVNSAAWSTDVPKTLSTGTSVYQVLTPEGPEQQVRTVVANSALTAGGPDAGSTADPLQVRQRFIAETALLSTAGKGTTATTVVLPPRGWDADGSATATLAGLLNLPWLEPVTVTQVLEQTPKPPTVAAPDAPKENGSLSGTQLSLVKQLETELTTYQNLLSEPGNIIPEMRKGLLQSTSLAWQGFPAQADLYARIQLGSVRGQLGKVHLVSSVDKGKEKEIKVNLAGSNGTFPLTIANDLDHSVRVKVIVRSANRNDLRVNNVAPVTVRAGQKWTPRITASAEQNGLIKAEVQVVTANGEPIGKPRPMLIQASQYGSVGWVLVGAACALLFGTSFVRIYRRIRRERRNPPADDGSTEASTEPETDPLHPAPLPAAPATPDVGTPADASLKEGVGSKDG